MNEQDGYIRNRWGLWLALVLGALLVAGVTWATTPHTITVDGDLSDFAADEKTPGDPVGDSLYGKNNDLSTLYVTWDANNLYLGFDYVAWTSAVMYLVETGKSGGVSQFCKSAGYGGAFPANVKGPGLDLMVAFWAPNKANKPNPYVYLLANKTSQDITKNTGIKVQLSDKIDWSKFAHTGQVEVAIPFYVLYGLGAGKVPKGAKLRIAGAVRGMTDDDGLGDVSPNPTGGVVNKNCTYSASTTLDKFHTVTLDQDQDGKPDKYWAPGPNSAGPKPDTKPWPDAAWPDTQP